MVSVLVGLSVTMASLLKLVPMSVLFGVFLYMGVTSMTGIQFFERLRLLFMPVKYHPLEAFVRRVQTWKMHLFTIVQILALAILWAVKSSSYSLAFPFFLLMMVPLRQKMATYYTEREINAVSFFLFFLFFVLNKKNLYILMISLMEVNPLMKKKNLISMISSKQHLQNNILKMYMIFVVD